jgi:hypothetical protein
MRKNKKRQKIIILYLYLLNGKSLVHIDAQFKELIYPNSLEFQNNK